MTTGCSFEVLKILVNASASCSAHTLRRRPGTSSGLGHLCGLIFFKDLHTSSEILKEQKFWRCLERFPVLLLMSNIQCPRPAQRRTPSVQSLLAHMFLLFLLFIVQYRTYLNLLHSSMSAGSLSLRFSSDFTANAGFLLWECIVTQSMT